MRSWLTLKFSFGQFIDVQYHPQANVSNMLASFNIVEIDFRSNVEPTEVDGSANLLVER